MEKNLANDGGLQSLLADRTLQSLLMEIDAAEDRGEALKEAKTKYPAFVDFVDNMLLQLGALKEEKGRLIFMAWNL